MQTTDKHNLREAVRYAISVYPNAHLGDATPREDIRSAFILVRRELRKGATLPQAITELECDAYRYEDM